MSTSRESREGTVGDVTAYRTEREGEGRAVPHLGTLTRTLAVSVERLYENALDWEHLPWLHRSSFSSIEIRDQGSWGWRARASLTGTEPLAFVELELKLDREARRWITTTLEGPGAGSETWTHAFEVGERETYIVVDFFSPGLEEELREKTLAMMQSLYTQLYDEDEAMMLDRQAALDERTPRADASTETAVTLGAEDELRGSLPRTVEAFGRPWRLVDAGGELVAHAARCPHRLGTLEHASIEGREIVCPWHGYRFDLTTRECTTGAKCRLPEAPTVLIEDGQVSLRLP